MRTSSFQCRVEKSNWIRDCLLCLAWYFFFAVCLSSLYIVSIKQLVFHFISNFKKLEVHFSYLYAYNRDIISSFEEQSGKWVPFEEYSFQTF